MIYQSRYNLTTLRLHVNRAHIYIHLYIISNISLSKIHQQGIGRCKKKKGDCVISFWNKRMDHQEVSLQVENKWE